MPKSRAPGQSSLKVDLKPHVTQDKQELWLYIVWPSVLSFNNLSKVVKNTCRQENVIHVLKLTFKHRLALTKQLFTS